MTPTILNLLAQLPTASEHENFQTLFESASVRIERIVSDGQSSPSDFWYDQPHDEWVMLIQGEAVLEFSAGEQHDLRRGDSLCIPAHCRHRVARTGPRTVWLAVHVFRAERS
jgi:cupin 2 domain-containing protein